MPIQVRCSGCEGVFRVPDKGAGKKVKCPKCSSVIQVPAAESVETTAPAEAEKQPAPKKTAAAPQPKSTSDQWYVKTADGETYGPVEKSDLDDWVVEGRVDEQDQLLQEGTDQWQWANDVYPDLAGEPLAEPGVAQQPIAEDPLGVAGDPLGVAGGELLDEPIPDEPIAEVPIPDEPAPTLPAAPTTQTIQPQQAPAQPVASVPAQSAPIPSGEQSDRRRKTAGLLGIFLCLFASHQFYLGNVGRGVFQAFLSLCTVGIGSIWSLIEGILILAGKINTDSQGRRLRDD